jgi:hypothetical protein
MAVNVEDPAHCSIKAPLRGPPVDIPNVAFGSISVIAPFATKVRSSQQCGITAKVGLVPERDIV